MALSWSPPGPVAARFMASIASVQIIAGPLGSGKSTACLMKLIALALAQPTVDGIKRSRFCILRNTTAQLRDTVKPLIDAWLQEMPDQPLGTWNLTELKFRLKMQLADDTIVESEFWLMAADTPDDVRRLLSAEFTAAWIEEAREIVSEVMAGLQGRIDRYPSRLNGGVAYACVICSTNMPNVGSYWHDVTINVPDGWEVFLQPAAVLDDLSLNPERENAQFLPEDYYEKLIPGKKQEWIDVFLKCKYGTDMAGLPVYKSSFSRQMHVSKAHSDPLRTPGYPVIIGMDNGLQAAAVLIQSNPRGRLIVLDECYVPDGVTMGVDRFLDNLLVPLLRRQYYGCKFIFVLDPACWIRQQKDEKTIASGVSERDSSFVVTKAVTNDPEKRIGAVENALVRQLDGDGWVQINPHCKHLINACEFGYIYAARKDGSPNVTNAPVKNHFSHVSDGFQYGVLHFNAPVVDTRTKARTVRPAERYWG